MAATEDDDDKDTWLGRLAMPMPSVMGARVAIWRRCAGKDSYRLQQKSFEIH